MVPKTESPPCPHDAWLKNCIVLGIADSGRKRKTAIRIRLLSAYRHGFSIRKFCLSARERIGHRVAWVIGFYDEFRHSSNRCVVHEIEWEGIPEYAGIAMDRRSKRR